MGGVVPTPDVEALHCEILTLREILKGDISALHDLLDEKIDGHWRLDDQRFMSARGEAQAGLQHLREMFEAERTAQEEANGKALSSIDQRFHTVNEFRGVLTDVSGRMATRDQLDGLSEKLEAERSSLEARFEALYQRNRGDIDRLSSRLDLREGEEHGSRLTKGGLYTAVGVAIAFLTFMVIAANYISVH